MKADLSLPENRAAFMALYIGHKMECSMNIFMHGSGTNTVQKTSTAVLDITFTNLHQAVISSNAISEKVIVRPISSLTEEEYQHVATLLGYSISVEEDTAFLGEQFCENGELEDVVKDHPNLSGLLLNIADWLRSIGILIPFRGNSCEEIIEAGIAIYSE